MPVYAFLLLDEGSAITFTVFLFQAIPVVLLYGVTMVFILLQARFARLRPLGLFLSGILAFIGVRIWPEHHIYRDYNYGALVAACLLFIPLLLTGLTYWVARQSPKKKLVISGVPLTPEDVAELQTRLADPQVAVEVRETSAATDQQQLLFQDFTTAVYKSDTVISEVLTPLYARFKPLIAYVQSRYPVKTIGLQKTLIEDQGWQLRFYLVAPVEQFPALLNAVDALPRRQLRSARADGYVLICYEETGQLTVTDSTSEEARAVGDR